MPIEPVAARVAHLVHSVQFGGMEEATLRWLRSPQASRYEHHVLCLANADGGEDEFVLVLSGEVVLVMDDREQVMRAGDVAGFPAGVAGSSMIASAQGSSAARR